MKSMKRTVLLIVIITFLVTVSASANEVSAVWTRLYNRATSLSQKYNIMQNIVEQNSRDMIPVLEKALEDQIANFQNMGNTTSRMENTRFTKLVVKELGRLRDRNAGHLLWQVVENAKDPLLKGEALIAIGRVGSKDYITQMNLMLRNLNLNFGKIQDKRANEIVAYALVIALERLKQPSSYSPLFFAANGWYSRVSGVKEKAEAALSLIVEDPSKQLKKIITDIKDYNLKLSALTAEEQSKASDANKGDIAVTALDQGLIHLPQNLTEKAQLKSLREKALSILKNNSAKPESAVPLLKSMVVKYQTQRLFDEDEMIQVFAALGTFTSDTSAQILSDFLSYLTDRKESGGTISSRLAKSLIIAMGNNGNKNCFEELTRAQYSDAWEPSVKREVKRALEKLKK